MVLYIELILSKRYNSIFSFLFFARCSDRSPLCACVHPCRWKYSVSELSASACVRVSVGGCRTMPFKVQRYLTFATGLVECLCFAGAVFGWASLVFVLKTEGFFSSLCVNTTGVNATQILGQFDFLTSTTLNSICLSVCIKSNQKILFYI